MRETQWEPISTETLPWERDPDELAFIPKSRRRAILPTYEAAVPLAISDRDVELDAPFRARIADLELALVRFDAEMSQRGYDLPALLLRSESSSSSQIENLTSSARNVALAELGGKSPRNALLVSRNIDAMRAALTSCDELTVESICAVHRALMGDGGGEVRSEQVWVGGTPYSPHGALYVAPAAPRVPELLEDLCAYSRRGDVSAIVKAAVVHAQFETIHPFIDGNGRTGRTLLHKVLRNEGVLAYVTLPVSAGLLHNIDAYMQAIERYHAGDPIAIVTQVADALEVALSLGMGAAERIGYVLDEWASLIRERSGAAIHRLPPLLVQHPVVNAALVSSLLGITERAARDLIARAEEYGILRRVGTARRGVFWQADDIIELLDDLASAQTVHRLSW